MDTTVDRFNQNHFVGHVTKGKVAEGLPTDHKKIDLRFLRAIALSDTYDGVGDPSSGVDYRAVLYGNQIAWEEYADYHMGSCEQRAKAGNELYRRLYFASKLYLKIQAIGRGLFFRQRLERGADTFYMSTEDLALLRDHPQYKEMVEDFGLELQPTEDGHHFKVAVTKFYQRT